MANHARFLAFGPFLLVAAAAMAGPDDVSHDPGVAPHAGLDDVYARFRDAYATLDADALGTLYTEGALYLSPTRDIQRGRDAIDASFRSMFERAKDRGETLDIRFHIVDRQVHDDLATDVGIYTLARSSDGETKSDRGKFVVVALRDADGVWRFHVDGYSAMPPP
jgi:uncharacterized protein (TIGR02246 family)